MNLDKLLSRYDHMLLECDGLTRVLHYVLDQKEIPHIVYYGLISSKAGSMPHYWIKLKDNRIVDYRARMWFGDQAPHGIFNPDDQDFVTYEEKDIPKFKLNEFVLRVLGIHPVTLEIL